MTPFPEYPRANIPALTTKQMIEVDRVMMDVYHIKLIQMMENAGRLLAVLARDQFLGGDPRGKCVTVLAGRGGNGGGALVAARRLAAWGCNVEICLSRQPDDFSGIPQHQLRIVQEMGIPVSAGLQKETPPELILDGIIGYSLSGGPTGMAATLINWANDYSAPILALDVPSGLDLDTGQLLAPSIRAAATLTLALPKAGLADPRVGDLYLGDISVPPELYSRFLGFKLEPVFAAGDILKLV